MKTILCNTANFSAVSRKEKDIRFIVVHYTGNNGDTAKNNCNYYRNNVVGASANFFVDDTEIICSVPWYFTAWHCGTKNGYKHPECRNSNSIGIEMCSRMRANGTYYFTDAVMDRAAEFVALQMKYYSVTIDRVVRHYDVTGKLCPRPFVDSIKWNDFKRKVMEKYNGLQEEKEGEEVSMIYYEKLDEIPAGEMLDTVKKLIDHGTIKGDKNGNLHLSQDMVRVLVFNNREGVYK